MTAEDNLELLAWQYVNQAKESGRELAYPIALAKAIREYKEWKVKSKKVRLF